MKVALSCVPGPAPATQADSVPRIDAGDAPRASAEVKGTRHGGRGLGRSGGGAG